MKRVTRILVVAMLLVSMLASAAFAGTGTKVTASTVEVKNGVATVEFKISGNTGFAGYEMKVNYDASKMTLTDIQAGVLSDGYFVGNADAAMAVFGNASDIKGDGVLFTATFKVNAEATDAAQNLAVSADVIELYNESFDDIDATVVAGGVTVPAKPADPVDPTDPTDPADPTDPTDPADPTDPTKPADPAEPEKDKTVQTGDNFNVMLFGGIAFVALMAAGGAVLVRRKNN